MPGRFRWRVARVLAIVVGVFVLAIGVQLWWSFAAPLPTDTDLRKRFHAHRAEFDSLAAMALADTLLVGVGGWPLTGVFIRGSALYSHRLTADEVVATGRSGYARLLARAGVPSISRLRDRNTVYFVVGSNHREHKGYLYQEVPMDYGLSSSLDRGVIHGYIELAPRWFIFVEPSD